MIDLAFRTLYRTAYTAMRVYWAIRRPNTHGALVAVWHQDRILLVQNSYTQYRSLPGGYVRRGETGREAARRELKEEVGLEVSLDSLVPTYDRVREWEGKQDRVEIFTLEVESPPSIEVDRREVVAAGFYPVQEARRLRLFPPIHAAIETYLARSALREV
ncbi:MAG: NUDIX hydrolase [Myxococcota bacterium]